MALNFSELTFPMTQGTDRSVDEKLAQGPSLLENVIWNKEGSIGKRPGMIAMSTGTFDTTTLSGTFSSGLTGTLGALDNIKNIGKRINSDGIEQLVVETSSSLFTYNSNTLWTKAGEPINVSVREESILAGAISHDRYQSQYGSGIRVIGYSDVLSTDSTGSNSFVARTVVVDGNTEAILTELTLTADGEPAAAACPQPVVQSNGVFGVFYLAKDSGFNTLKVRYIDPAKPYQWSSAVQLEPSASVGDYRSFKAIPWSSPSNLSPLVSTVVASITTNNDISVQAVGTSGIIYKSALWNVNDAIDILDALKVSDRFWVLYKTATQIRIAIGDKDLVLISQNEVLNDHREVIGDAIVRQGVGYVTNTADYVAQFFLEFAAALTDSAGYPLDDNLPHSWILPVAIKHKTVPQILTGSNIIHHALLGSKPWRHNGEDKIILNYVSPDQGLAMICDWSGSVQGAYGRDKISRSIPISEIETIDTNKYGIVWGARGDLESRNGSSFFRKLLYHSDISFDAPASTWSNPKDLLFRPGSVPRLFDGNTDTELGFLLAPQLKSYPPVNQAGDFFQTFVTGASGSISAGTRQYYSTYHWTDRAGNEYRSSPSVAATVITTGSHICTVKPQFLTFTDKDDIRVKIWRTENNGFIPYLISSGSTQLFNNKLLASGSFIDDVSDSELINNEILYTATGELPNISSPAGDLSIVWNNRLWITSTDGVTLYYSKPMSDGLPPQFAVEMSLKMNRGNGKITGLAVMDSSLIVFYEDAIEIVVGEGLDIFGRNDSLQVVTISGELGCNNSKSIVENSRLGVFFANKNGIYLLGRGRNLLFIGAQVRDIFPNGNITITSSESNQDLNIMTWTLSDGTQLAYDTELNRWSLWKGKYRTTLTNYNDNLMCSSGSIVYTFTSGTHYDTTTNPYSMTYKSPWIHLGGIIDFQRVNRVTFVGTMIDTHSLSLTVEYDYNTSDTRNYSVEQQVGVFVTGSVIEWTHHLRHQKCEAIRFSLSDIDQDNLGKGFELQALKLKVGLKSGHNKLSENKKLG